MPQFRVVHMKTVDGEHRLRCPAFDVTTPWCDSYDEALKDMHRLLNQVIRTAIQGEVPERLGHEFVTVPLPVEVIVQGVATP